MKNIMDYFDSKPSDTSPVVLKEVSAERAKIDDATDLINKEDSNKKKRGRVKIKISRKSNDSTVCNILENSSDLVDRTPTPTKNSQKQVCNVDGDTPKRKLQTKSTLELNGQSTLGKNKQSKKKSNADKVKTQEKNQENDSGSMELNGQSTLGKNKQSKKKSNADKVKTQEKNQENDSGSMSNKVDENPKKSKNANQINEGSSNQKKQEIKQKRLNNLIEIADKKGYSKRKAAEDEEAAKIEKRLEKRKKMFTVQQQKDSDANQSDENTPKNNDLTTTKRSSLLNYFSKATPEQLEKERLMKTKVTIKADVHTPIHSPTSTPVTEKKNDLSKNDLSNKDLLKKDSSKKELSKKKNRIIEKQIQQEFDEICIIDSETLVVSPEKKALILKSPLGQSKQKWSLKIQLQSNNVHEPSSTEDEEIYTPSSKKKENIEKIPKVLLPMKNKKGDSNSPTVDANSNASKIKEKKISKVVEEKILQPENHKTELYFNNNKSESKYATLIKESEDDCQVIEENPLKRKPQEKLAPLFTKKIKPNPEVVAARRLFLQSDIAENGDNNAKKVVHVGPVTMPFPKISHINQLSVDNSDPSQIYSFSLKQNEKSKPSFNSLNMKTVLKLNDKLLASEILYECVESNIDIVLSELEPYYPDVKALWDNILPIIEVQRNKQTSRTRRRASDKKNSKKENNNLNILLNSLWTDKYKPNNTGCIVGNEEAALKLKLWLDGWKQLKDNDYSSGEEFYNSDGETSSSIDNNPVAVLTGPHGCGKTASVYAVAQELGYKVLEVNASSKRPGKKILKDFEEATKSHRVKKSEYQNVFVNVKKKVEETKEISQNSLILFEDVDLIFEEDEGFVSAAFQLASNTKRPIIMTLRDTCSHLCKLAPNQLKIHFQPVNSKKAVALLQLIALAETGYKLSQNCIDTLFQSGDLRKSLLQLQYVLVSCKERISPTSLAVNNASWGDMKTFIYKPAIRVDKTKQKKQSTKDERVDKDIFDKLVKNLDNFTVVSNLIHIEDPTSQYLNLKFEPCMSLIENKNVYSSLESTSLEIGNWLNNAIKQSSLEKLKKSNIQTDRSHFQRMIKKQINSNIDFALTQIVSNTLDRRALNVDYFSSIRTICRAEELRNQTNSKRGNRFFHYLQNSRLAGGTKTNNILSAACKVLEI